MNRYAPTVHMRLEAAWLLADLMIIAKLHLMCASPGKAWSKRILPVRTNFAEFANQIVNGLANLQL